MRLAEALADGAAYQARIDFAEAERRRAAEEAAEKRGEERGAQRVREAVAGALQTPPEALPGMAGLTSPTNVRQFPPVR